MSGGNENKLFRFEQTAFPTFVAGPLADDELLAGYEQWDDKEDLASHLGGVEKLDEIEIRPIKELRSSHHPKQLEWQARTNDGKPSG